MVENYTKRNEVSIIAKLFTTEFDISKEKIDFPKFKSVFSDVKKHRYNFYQLNNILQAGNFKNKFS